MKHFILIMVLFSLLGCSKQDPIVMWHTQTDLEKMPSFTLNSDDEKISFFTMTKEIYCSDNIYAKELVDKYKITSNSVECP